MKHPIENLIHASSRGSSVLPKPVHIQGHKAQLLGYGIRIHINNTLNFLDAGPKHSTKTFGC